MKPKIEILNSKHFILRYNNPSPGNPLLRSLDFDDKFVYAIWLDGSVTKTPVERIEEIYDEDKELDGIDIWFTNALKISLKNFEDDEDFEDFDGY